MGLILQAVTVDRLDDEVDKLAKRMMQMQRMSTLFDGI
jgi:hypothetical protein